MKKKWQLNTEMQKSWVPGHPGGKGYWVAPKVGGFSVWNLLLVTILAPRILRWLVEFWKIWHKHTRYDSWTRDRSVADTSTRQHTRKPTARPMVTPNKNFIQGLLSRFLLHHISCTWRIVINSTLAIEPAYYNLARDKLSDNYGNATKDVFKQTSCSIILQ